VVEVFFSQSVPSFAYTFYGWQEKQLPDGTGIFGRLTPRGRLLRRRDGGEDAPFAGHALTFVSAALLEPDS
jgi:hypothetical protein